MTVGASSQLLLPLGKKETEHSWKSDKISSSALEGEVKGGYKCEWGKMQGWVGPHAACGRVASVCVAHRDGWRL